MFTGIIESTGTIKEIISTGTNKSFWVSSPLAGDLKIDQSLSQKGVCLTIEEIKDGMHRVTAIEEMLVKTNLGSWQINDIINLERCMQMNGRLDGHIVQGHVDCTAKCISIVEKAGSWEFSFVFPIQNPLLRILKYHNHLVEDIHTFLHPVLTLWQSILLCSSTPCNTLLHSQHQVKIMG